MAKVSHAPNHSAIGQNNTRQHDDCLSPQDDKQMTMYSVLIYNMEKTVSITIKPCIEFQNTNHR